MKIVFAIIAGLILAFFAFSAVKPTQKMKQKAVFYYPEANVYHDLGHGDYYFYHAEQKEWVATKKISSQQESSLGEKVAVPIADPVWKNNYQDRLIHSVQLFAEASVIKKHFLEDSLKIAIPRNKPEEVTGQKESPPSVEERPKKGLKKFFDKIFGKKEEEKNI